MQQYVTKHPSSPRPRSRPLPFLTCRRTATARRWAVVAMLAMLLSGNGAPLFMPAPVVHAQAGSAVGFVLNAGDLRFIFHAIEIAQEHAAGNPLLGLGPNQVNEERFPHGLRTVDGSFNHLSPGMTNFGAADQVFPRIGAPVFRQGEGFDPDGPGPQPVNTAINAYLQNNGVVIDSQPRIISNLISDQTVRNPAAVSVATASFGGTLPPAEPLGTLPIGNVAPDVGLSAPFNVMFTFFGQFFDHGLDLVPKGGNGSVIVPLQPDDPLFVPGGQTNFMALTRATKLVGPDGVQGTADDIRESINITTPFVDQNQTYTSHPSHQVFLREYEFTTGRAVPTGRMIDGGGPGVRNIGNWGEVKAQALLMGIRLVDADVTSVPTLRTDPYGHFVPGPLRGAPQFVLQNGTFVEADPAAPITVPANVRRTGHAFLDDIAHNAVPTAAGPDANLTIDPISPINAPNAPYDNELLDAHFVTGDGRGNENIALTAVHTVFHAEHNRARDYVDQLIPQVLTAAEVNAWHAVHPGSGWGYGERLFQAARFITEMQYQHLVFEEFARKLVPSINPFIGDGINFINGLNPAISAEFAHAAYRLGHSMLTETISRTRPDGTTYDIPLLNGFLNPLEFNSPGNAGPRLTAAEAAGAIFQGGTRQIAAEIDEFVTEAVRNRLLGLPLDLGVLNIARGRSEALPGLNGVRLAAYLSNGDPGMLPYTSWMDFRFNLRNDDSLVNFIAAYGIHPSLTGTMQQKRDAAQALIDGNPAFMFQSAATSGVDRIDLWIGGLAEAQAPFGSMLGTTFNYIFEHQLESLQNADRFYYLERLDGLNFLSQLEGNSFAELIKRNTTLTGVAADVFARPGLVFNLAQLRTMTTAQLDALELVRLPGIDNVFGNNDDQFRYLGAEHVIWNGSPIGDNIFSSEGDDTLTGGAGNDRMEGGSGNDNFVGGDGNDILMDVFGDDVIKGGPGNDAIAGGPGIDLLQGNEGSDYIVAGNDLSEVFGGPGNDFIYMGAGLSESVGGAGNDWMEGTDSPASIAIGDDNNQFQNDPNGGHDIALAGPGDMDFDMEGGDDIMVGNVVPTHRFEGMLGFDWVTYRGETVAVDADMLITGAIAVNAPLNEGRDRYDLVEGLSGTNFNDLLRGDNRLAADLANDGLTGVNNGHVLNNAGIQRIPGLAAILPAGATSFGAGNIILGGPGSDLLEGRGGDDILDGDRWLNVQISAPNPEAAGLRRQGATLLYDGMRLAPKACIDVPANCSDIEKRTLREAIFATVRPITVTSLQMERSVVTTSTAGTDTALFSGPRENYTITATGNAANRVITVTDNVGTDGTDTIRNVEVLQFTNGTVATVGVGANIVPLLTGLTDAQARAAITAAGLVVGTVTTGTSQTVQVNRVSEQSPLPGVGVNAGTVVNFVITLGALVPDIHELPIADGRAGLTAANLVPAAAVRDVNDPEIPAGLVAGTDPAAGSIVPPGSTVTILRSIGPVVTGIVPAVVGLLQADAEELILAAGFTLGAETFANSTTVAEGAIISTNPAAGLARPAGTAIARVTSLGTVGLVAALGFEETGNTNVDDTSVVGATGTIRGALRVPGKIGNALFFDGVNDWVTFADTTGSAIDLGTGMTIEAWVNPGSQMTDWNTVVLKERGAGNLSYGLYAHDGFPQPSGFNSPAGYTRTNPVANTTDRAVRTNAPLPINQWTHLATTYDGANMRLYVNGVLVSTQPQTGSLSVSNGALRIGGNNVFAGGEFFHGLIDEVRIYNRALTVDQIQADMVRPIR